MQWANEIAAKPAYERRAEMNKEPPKSLRDVFLPSDHPVVERLQNDVIIAQRVNAGLRHEVDLLEMKMERLKVVFMDAFEDARLQVNDLKHHINNNADLLSGFDEAVKPK